LVSGTLNIDAQDTIEINAVQSSKRNRLFAKWCLVAVIVFFVWSFVFFFKEQIHPFFLVLYSPIIVILLAFGIIASIFVRKTAMPLSGIVAVPIGAIIGLAVDFFVKYSTGWFLFSGLGDSEHQATFWSNLDSFGTREWLVASYVSVGGALAGAIIAYGLVRAFGLHSTWNKQNPDRT
jgi:hypothetical protein